MLKSFLRLLFTFDLFILFGVFHNAQAQYLNVDTVGFIEWSDKLYLNWNDYRFENRSNRDGGAMALTSVRHTIRGGIIEGKPMFEVKVLFVKKDSWTTDSTNIALLAHEKLHFDIAELYGRKIRKQIEDLFKRGERDIKIYKKYVKQLLGDFQRFSREYDSKTQHGNDFDQQKRWFEIVFSELERLSRYYK